MRTTPASCSRHEPWSSGKHRQALRPMLGLRSPSYSKNEIPNHHRLRSITRRDHSQVDSHSALKFVGEHVDLFDAWRLRQECACVCHQRFGDCACKMRVASCVIWKNVEDAEFRLRKANSEPSSGGSFRLAQRHSGTKKLLYLGFLA